MKNREYAALCMEAIVFEITKHDADYIETEKKKNYKRIKTLLKNFSALLVENKKEIIDLEIECKCTLDKNMAYALKYLEIYKYNLNIPKLCHEVNILMLIYSLSEAINRGLILVEYYVPDGKLLSNILRACYFGEKKRDIEIQQNLGVGRTIYYEKKRKALEYLGFYFYCIVIPQSELLLVETN